MRHTCYACARKHLAQADILMMEAAMGYPFHAWYAMGHMAEAADELVEECPLYANHIREQRKLYEDSVLDVEAGAVDGQHVRLDITAMIADITLLADGEDERKVLADPNEETSVMPAIKEEQANAE